MTKRFAGFSCAGGNIIIKYKKQFIQQLNPIRENIARHLL
jgi:hypothetical protein